MTPAPDDIMRKAFDLVEAMASNKTDMISASDTRYANALTDDANAIARAIMDERGRCAGVVNEIAERHREASDRCYAEGLRDAAALASYAARSIDDVAAAILKGEV